MISKSSIYARSQYNSNYSARNVDNTSVIPVSLFFSPDSRENPLTERGDSGTSPTKKTAGYGRNDMHRLNSYKPTDNTYWIIVADIYFQQSHL